MKYLPTNFVGMMLTIMATGAILNFANQGKLGKTAQDISKFVTTGYGAGAIN